MNEVVWCDHLILDVADCQSSKVCVSNCDCLRRTDCIHDLFTKVQLEIAEVDCCTRTDASTIQDDILSSIGRTIGYCDNAHSCAAGCWLEGHANRTICAGRQTGWTVVGLSEIACV